MSRENTYRLKSAPSTKKYNVGKFENEKICQNPKCLSFGKSYIRDVCPRCKTIPAIVPELQKCQLPLRMYREQPRVAQDIEDDEEPPEEQAGQRKRRMGRRRPNLTPHWVIEDNAGDNKFVGAKEGLPANYVLFILNEKNEFEVLPVEQWFRFKKPLSFTAASLEEAESITRRKQEASNRWLQKHKALAGKDALESQNNEEKVVAPPRVRTGAASERAVKDEDNFDIFTVPSKPRRTFRSAKDEREEDGDMPAQEDGADVEDKMSDDESDAEITNEVNAAQASESEDDLLEDVTKLTATGQDLKALLKKEQAGDRDNQQSDGEEEEVGFMDYLPGSVFGIAKPKQSPETDKRATSSSKAAEPPKTEDRTKKRPLDDAPDGEPPSKRSTAPTPAAPRPAQVGISEPEVIEELLRVGGRMKTKDLVKRFRKRGLLKTDDDFLKLKDIIHRVSKITEDVVDGQVVVLKDAFRK